MDLTELKEKKPKAILAIAKDLGLDNASNKRIQDVIFDILKKHAGNGDDIFGGGVLEVLPDGFGFLRSASCSYLAGPDDIYVSPSQIRRFGLRKGDTLRGKIRPPKQSERYFALKDLETINGELPAKSKRKIPFESLVISLPPDRSSLSALLYWSCLF